MTAARVKSLALDMAALAAGGSDSLDSFGWCSAAEDYRLVSYDLVRELCDFVSGLDQETDIAIALNAKLADIMIDLTRLSRLVVDVANLRRQGITPNFDAADNPIFAWLYADGPGDGAIAHTYNSLGRRRRKSPSTQRLTARTLRRWVQTIAIGPSRRVDAMSYNALLSQFSARDGRLLSNILLPSASWCRSNEVLPSAVDTARAIADGYEALLKREIDAAPALIDSAVRGAYATLRYHLGGALIDLAYLRRNGPRRIGHLLVSGTPKYVGRMLSRYYQERGSHVFRFAHGGERVFFEDYHWGITP